MSTEEDLSHQQDRFNLHGSLKWKVSPFVGIVAILLFPAIAIGGYILGTRKGQVFRHPVSETQQFTTSPTQLYELPSNTQPPPTLPTSLTSSSLHSHTPIVHEPSLIPSLAQTTTRQILYKYVPGWPKYDSYLGFSFQYPPSYLPPKKNSVDPGSSRKPYCEFSSIRRPPNNSVVESLAIKVLPYSGGSRRQFLIDSLALGKAHLITVEETAASELRGLLMLFQPDFSPPFSKVFAAVFVQGSMGLIISNYQINENLNEWNLVLGSLQISKDLHIDIQQCQYDWEQPSP